MRTKNTKWKNAQIANSALTQAHEDYINDPEPKKYRNSPERYSDFVTKFEGLLHRFTHHLTYLQVYNGADLREEAKVERANLKSLQTEIRILLSFRADWNERYGVTPQTEQLLLADYK